MSTAPSASESAGLVHADAPPHADIKFEQTAPLAEMLDACRTLHADDKRAERMRSKWQGWGATLLFGGFFATVLSLMFALWFLTPFFVVIVVVGVVLLVVGGVAGRKDIDDRKLDVVRGVIEKLEPELKTNRPVMVRLDFRSYEKTKPVENTTTFWSSSGVIVYSKPWLRMRFTLKDGTQVSVGAVTTCKRKQKQKRKYVKKKDKVVDELTVWLRPPRGKQLNATAEAQAQARVGTGGRAVLTAARVKPKVAVFKFRSRGGQRLRTRGGWSLSNAEGLLDGSTALFAVAMSYHLLVQAGAGESRV